jgi:hypothetical protein
MTKTISLIILMIFSTLVLQAQKTKSSKTTFGLRGGINFQNITGKDEDGEKLKNDILAGFNIGLTAAIPVAPDFYFQPGLLFTTKGATNEEIFLGQTYKTKMNISYIEMPLNLLYKPVLGKGHMLLGFGPYVALGVNGKETLEGNGVDESRKVKFKSTVTAADPNDVAYLKSIDAGANLLAGYEFSNAFSFQLNFQLGLTRINPKYEGSSNDKSVAKNTGFGLSLGYRFN